MQNRSAKHRQNQQITGIDALGRTISAVDDFRTDRYVGMFYFMYKSNEVVSSTEEPNDSGFTPDPECPSPLRSVLPVRDVEELLATDPQVLWNEERLSGNWYCTEPLFGYYDHGDPWVIAKHIELFIEAGIDFVCFDITNGAVEPRGICNFMDIAYRYYREGWNVPKICFFTNFTHFLKAPERSLLKWLYDHIYAKNLYPELWFYGPYDKPLMIGYPDSYAGPLSAYLPIQGATAYPEGAERLDPEIVEFFHWRRPQWPTQKFDPNGFPYVSIERPQRVHTDTISVSVAQLSAGAMSWEEHPPVPFKGMFTNRTKGRGWSGAVGENVKENVPFDTNYQEQWDQAIAEDPAIVFLTGWNEWGAGKFLWKRDGYVTPSYVDCFNIEYSRDIEMMRGGLLDNTFMKTVANIRAYKGVTGETTQPVGVDVGCAEDPAWIWEDGIAYYGRSFARIARDSYGSKNEIRYTSPQPENPVEEIRVAHSADNVYFYLRMSGPITPRAAGQTNHHVLFIRVEGSDAPSFEGFHYAINRNPTAEGKTSLEVSVGGYRFIRKGDIDCDILGDRLQIRVPKKELGIVGPHFSLSFKYANGVENEADIMDYYISGDVLPLGRLAYGYNA